MLRKIFGEEELASSLNVSGGQSSLVVVSDQFGGLEGELLEHIDNQRVDDFHSLLRDTDVVGDGLQHLVNVKGERLEVLLLFSSNNLFSHDNINFLFSIYIPLD